MCLRYSRLCEEGLFEDAMQLARGEGLSVEDVATQEVQHSHCWQALSWVLCPVQVSGWMAQLRDALPVGAPSMLPARLEGVRRCVHRLAQLKVPGDTAAR